MPTTALAGERARATVEEPNGHNDGGCAFCGASADGYDATAEVPLCRECAMAFRSFRHEVLGVDA